MEIILPGYEAIFENNVYRRDSQAFPGCEDILVLKRHVKADEEAMVKYLVKTLNTLEQARKENAILSLSANSLEAALFMTLKPLTREHLAKGSCEECFDLIKAASPAPVPEEGQELPAYLQVLYGAIPEDLAERSERGGATVDNLWYSGVLLYYTPILSNGLGIKIRAEVELEDGAFPRQYRDRISLQTSGTSLKMVDELVGLLKRNFDTAERVSQLVDTSQGWLEDATKIPIVGLDGQLNQLSAKHEGKPVEAPKEGNPVEKLFSLPQIKVATTNKLN